MNNVKISERNTVRFGVPRAILDAGFRFLQRPEVHHSLEVEMFACMHLVFLSAKPQCVVKHYLPYYCRIQQNDATYISKD